MIIYRCKLTDHTGQRAPQRAESRRKMNLKFGEKKTTKTENKASIFEGGGPLAVEGVEMEGVPSLASTCGGSYFPIYHFMTKELGLGGAKLLVYALIYSFTVSEGSFFGSRGYICEACGINSLRTVDRVLRELTNEGLLMRLDKVGADCVTYAAVKIKDIGKKCMGKNSTPPEQKMPIPPAKIAHNNKDYNKTNIHTSIHAISVYAHAKEGITKEGNKNGENRTPSKGSFTHLGEGG